MDENAKTAEHDNLLAVTQVLTGLGYNDQRLFDIFGGKEAMIESPVLSNLIAEQVAKSMQKNILVFLENRFVSVPPALVQNVCSINDESRLERLVGEAAVVQDLRAFQQKLGE